LLSFTYYIVRYPQSEKVEGDYVACGDRGLLACVYAV
jgi:hypothetical protein